MPKAEVTLLIDRPVEEVFSYLTDYESYNQWDLGITGIQREPQGPIKVGTQLTETRDFMGRATQTVSHITTLETNRLIVRSGDAPPSRGSIDFVEVGTGTRVTYSLKIDFGGAMSLLDPIISLVLQRDLKKSLYNFKEKLERDALHHSSHAS